MAAYLPFTPSAPGTGRVPITGAPAVHSLAVLGLVAGGLVLWLVMSGGRALRNAYVGPLLAGLLLAGLVFLPSGLGVLWNDSAPTPAPAIAREKPPGGGRQWFPQNDGFEVMSPNLSALFGIRDVRFCMPLTPRRLMPLVGKLRFGFLGFNRWDSARLNMAGVAVTWSQHPGAVRLQPFRNPEALPRGFWVARARSAPDPVAATALALKEDAWRKTAFVEGLPKEDEGAANPAAGIATSSVKLVSDRSESNAWQVVASSRGWLVLRDMYWPGWLATVDGERTRIYPADGAFRAVKVAAGTHNIVFRYRPLLVIVGAVISMAAWLWLVWSGIVRRRMGNAQNR